MSKEDSKQEKKPPHWRYLTRPHDALFKDALSKKENAQSFLENYLPKHILNLIDLEELQIEKDSYVTKELEEYYSDLVYKVKINNREGYIYLLLEHKSYYERYLPLQLLEYMVQMWRLKIKQYIEKEEPKVDEFKLPIIIPLVIYHGEKRLSKPLNLTEIIDIPESKMKIYIPDYEYHLYDIPSYKDEELKGNVELRLMEWLFKYIRKPEFKDKFIEFLKSIPKENLLGDFILTVGIYVISASKITSEELIEIYDKYVPNIQGGQVMGTLQMLVEEGRKEGEKEGRKEGKRDAVIEILEERFGSVPEEIREAVQSIDNLSQLSFLVIKASTIENIEKFSQILMSKR